MLVPIFLLVLLVFANRYFGGRVFRALLGEDGTTGALPTVSIIVPLYNEGRRIHDTIARHTSMKIAIIVRLSPTFTSATP